MKKGLIIVFGKDDVEFENTIIFNLLYNQKVTICLVNNGNCGKVYDLLYRLKENSKSEILILSLKKEKPLSLAAKAGVRSLVNKENYEAIIYTEPKNISHENYNNNFIEVFNKHLKKRKDKRVLLRTLYAIDELK
ncbi:hypothetical protein [Polaribacter septentrionalilitoris]|uniref:hypothetical protein n=1 Tax=Polaribacter septentrionalilitoris TaxID=2494657 RepID=UPI001358601F|nr:hypothetical protein [Polaribacter septentrionalilitoris]